jgi:hypothetical protein
VLVFLVVPVATPRSHKEAPPESSSSSEDSQDDDSGSKASSAEDSDPDDGLPRNCDITQLPGGRSVQTKGRRRFVNWVNSQAARLDKTKPFNWNFTPLHYIHVSNNYIFFFSFFFFQRRFRKSMYRKCSFHPHVYTQLQMYIFFLPCVCLRIIFVFRLLFHYFILCFCT